MDGVSEVFYLGCGYDGSFLLDVLFGLYICGLAVMVLEESVEVAIVVIAVFTVYSKEPDLFFTGKTMGLIDFHH